MKFKITSTFEIFLKNVQKYQKFDSVFAGLNRNVGV